MNILLHYGYHPVDTGFYFEKTLSKEHNVTYCGPSYKFERPGFSKNLDLSKIEKKWDLFFYIDSYHPGFPLGIEKIPFPTACYLIDIPYNPKQKLLIAPFFDYVFIPHKEYLDAFRQVNKNVFWLPFACDPEVHRRYKGVEKIYDVGFVGGVKGEKRGKILDDLSRHFKLNDFRRFYAPSEMARVYSQSKIVFNMGRSGELNMRLFEAPSCGSLLLTERTKNGLNELFKDGEQLITYGPEDNLKDTIKYYLSHDEEREGIAEAGHKLVLEKHTYWHRVQTILETIKNNNYHGEAPARSWSEGKIFLAQTKVYSKFIMIDAICSLFAYTEVAPIYKIIALWHILSTFLRRLRQMNWRKFLKSIIKSGRASGIK